MNPKYVRLAHRKAVLVQLQRQLQSEFLTDMGPRKDMICEEVPFMDRVVSQDALHEIEDVLQELIDKEAASLRRFDFLERGPEKKASVVAQPAKKGKRDVKND